MLRQKFYTCPAESSPLRLFKSYVKHMLSTWIGAIARNAVTDYIKRASFQNESATDTMPEDGGATYSLTSAEDEFSFKDPNNERLYKILIKLTDEERDFLELKYCLELKNQEISQMLGISVKAIDNRYRRLLEKCRKIAAE